MARQINREVTLRVDLVMFTSTCRLIKTMYTMRKQRRLYINIVDNAYAM